MAGPKRSWARRLVVSGVGAASLLGAGLAVSLAVTASNAAVPDTPTTLTTWESRTGAANASPAPKLPYAEGASISGDGKIVAFDAAPNVAGAVTNYTIWTRDRSADANVAQDILANLPGVAAGDSYDATVSRNGCYVVFLTSRNIDTTVDANNGNYDVYRYTMPQCGGPKFDLASIQLDSYPNGQIPAGGTATSFGGIGNFVAGVEDFDRPVISADGQWIAFSAKETEVQVPPVYSTASANLRSIFLVDMSQTDPVARAKSLVKIQDRNPSPDQPDANGGFQGSSEPTISDDGRYIAYASDADASTVNANATSWPTPATTRIWLYDRVAKTLSLVSKNDQGAAANGTSSYQPSISADGTRIAFSSDATNLDLTSGNKAISYPCQQNVNPPFACTRQYSNVFLADRTASTTRLVSRKNIFDGGFIATDAGDSDSYAPSISGDGRFIAFQTFDRFLVPTPPNTTVAASGTSDLVMFTPPVGDPTAAFPLSFANARLSEQAADNAPAKLGAGSPWVDFTGRHVAFQSNSGDELLPAGTLAADPAGNAVLDGASEIFVRNRPATLTIDPKTFTFPGTLAGSQSAPTTFTLANPGNTLTGGGVDPMSPGVRLADVVLSGSGAVDFKIVGGTCVTAKTNPASPTELLPAGNTCTVQVAFAPLAVAGFNADVVASSLDAGPNPGQSLTASARLSGKGLAGGALTITPNPANFVDTQVGSTAAALTLTVKNTGDAALTLQSVASSLSDYAVVAGGTCAFGGAAPTALNPADTCTVNVTFKPAATGARNATFSVTSTGLKPATGTASLTGNGVAAALTVTPNPLDFGSSIVGVSTLTKTYTVKNTGIGPNKLGAITFTTGNATDFALQGTGTCVANTTNLAAGATCTIDARFKPGAVGARSSLVSVASQAPTAATATAKGNGLPVPIAPVYTLTITPSPEDFGTTTVGSQVARVLVVRNTGNVVNTIGAFTFGGVDAGDYSVIGNACTGVSLGVNATCDVTVGFKPLATGTRPATVTVNGSNGSSSTANLTGVGQNPPPVLLPQLSITPPSATFPQEIIGTPAPPQVFTVKNTGQAPDTLVGTSIAGLSFAEFLVTSNGCTPGLVLAVNATCTLSVGFTPADAGQRVATLIVNGSGGTSASAQLVGTGAFGPSMSFDPAISRPERNVVLTGRGFPRLSAVALVVTFGDQTQNVTVQTDTNGGFTTDFYIMANTPLGTRTVTAPAVVGKYPDVTTTLLVMADTFKPQRVVNPAFTNDTGLITRG